MEQAKKFMEAEQAALDVQFRELDKQMKSATPNITTLQLSLATIDLQMEDYVVALQKYLDELAANNKDAEFAGVIAKRNDYKKKKLVAWNTVQGIVSTTGGSTFGNSGGTTIGQTDPYRVRLPQRQIQKFNGDVRNWRSFWASFQEIDTDKGIPDIEKYHYLLQCMEPNTRPFQIVSSYPPAGTSYALARDELTDKFGRTKTLIKVYVRDLLKLVVENADGNSRQNFTGIVTHLTAQIRNLEQLGLTNDKYGVVLYPIVESCIPQEVLTRYLQLPGVKEEISEILDFLNEEVRRQDETALAQGPFGELPGKADNKTGKSNKVKSENSTPTTATFVNASGKPIPLCGFCEGKHGTQDCRKAITMTLQQRKEALKKSNRCFKCLNSGHSANKCNARHIICINCKSKHHILMCWGLDSSKGQQENGQSVSDNQAKKESHISTSPDHSTVNLANHVLRPEVLLQTVMVQIHGYKGSKIVRAMIDTGSQSSYVCDSLAKELGFRRVGEEKVTHQTFGAVVSGEVTHPLYTVEVNGLYSPHNSRLNFIASSIPTIANDVIVAPPGPWFRECEDRNITISNQDIEQRDIDLLIGNDISPYVKVGLRSENLPSGLIATESKLGWFLEGKIKDNEIIRKNKATMYINLQLTEVSKLWSLETLGILDSADVQSRQELEEAAMDHFRNTVSQDPTGRYMVKLPWIDGHPPLPSNRAQAIARVHSTTKDLIKTGHLEVYHNIFQSWLTDGIIEYAPDDDGNTQIHYLPHRAVFKPNSTTPTRPVFNASAKTKGNPSLNQCLEIGPNLLERIPTILTGFRMDKVGVTSDIRKAFLQILVDPEDRNFMRFFWWKDMTRTELVEFRHCRVVFGVSSSPFLLGAVLQHLLQENDCSNKETVNLLRKSFYVDNCATSLPSLELAKQFEGEASALFAKHQFDLRGWEYGPVEEEKLVSLLGLIWNTKYDTLQYDLSGFKHKLEGPFTKRSVLSIAHSIFDPLGLLAPFTIIIKNIFKMVCLDKEKYDWDAVLPSKYAKEVEVWGHAALDVQNVRIPRYFGNSGYSKDNWTLICCCDASKTAFASCVFLRINTIPVQVNMIRAVSRVTPEKGITIPRAELVACLLGARLVSTIKMDLGLEDISTYLLTDSTSALHWILDEYTVYGKFINNRVLEIRRLTNIKNWFHISGKKNPADIPSRGSNVDKLIQINWWSGPEWIHDNLPSSPYVLPEADSIVNSEKRKTVVSALHNIKTTCMIQDLCRLGDYHKLLRVVAFVLRFVKLCRASEKIIVDDVPEVDANELEKAEVVVIKSIQHRHWGNRPAVKFPVECDENGVWRVVTRLINGEDTAPFKTPALLPKNDPIVKMIIYKEHSLHSHAGVQYLQCILREKYWIINNRRTIRNVVHSCAICRVHLSKRVHVPEAPLPKRRIELTHCFDVTGIDLAGPLHVKNRGKMWIVIFTCAVFRGVHFELVESLSTLSFVQALRKFVARRGRPSTIYSDNGTNFHGCHNIFKGVDWKRVEQYATVNEIKWIFNPPSAAWWGGFWERLVGLMKQLLRRTLGTRCVDFQELEMIVFEVEAVMNNRPLTYISENPNDLQPITPSHFMRDLPTFGLPELEVAADDLTRRMRQIRRQKEDMRKRFRSEYLGQLLWSKSKKLTHKLQSGDVVLIEHENRKRWEWPIGVIVDTYAGKDGIIRTAQIKTTHGTFIRLLQRLFPLEIQGELGVPVAATTCEELPCAEEEDDGEMSFDTEEVEPVVITKSGRKSKKPDRFAP